MQPKLFFQMNTIPRQKLLSLSFIIVYLLLGVQACRPGPLDEPPGVGEKAERGYQICAPVINALNAFKQANGSYPPSLAELAPDYLLKVPVEVNNEPITYKLTTTSYQITFGYIGPGINICTYSPEKDWQCSGAY